MNKILWRERFETVPYVNVNQLIAKATAKLEKADITNPRLESELLLSHLLSLSRFDFYLKEIEFNGELIDKFERLLELRSKKYPLQHITGRANFMGLDFLVNPNVLVPRPETEILAEKAIDIVSRILNSPESLDEAHILDIGTGSGNIAVSLARHISKCRIWATDISPQALETAKKNAQGLKVEDKIIFILTDIWPRLGQEQQKFDLIVSNPPYLARSQFNALPEEIKFEPRLALDGGEEGLDFYGKIITQSISYLKKGGYLILELGDNQAQAVKGIVASVKNFAQPQIFKDLNNRERVILTKQNTEAYYG